jgi:hypothetical protein
VTRGNEMFIAERHASKVQRVDIPVEDSVH